MGLNVRAGVHSGEVEFRPDNVVRLAVSIAKRICDLADPGSGARSETVKGLIVDSGIAMSEQGTQCPQGSARDVEAVRRRGLTPHRHVPLAKHRI